MDKFDYQYAVKMRELIFAAYIKNKFIYGKIAYVIDGGKIYNII